MKIRKDDNVIIIAGKDKGKKAKVLKVFRDMDKVLVEGVNVVKRHQKSKQRDKAGEILEKAMPIDISNVALVEDGKAVRVGFKVEGDKKVRVSKKTGKVI